MSSVITHAFERWKATAAANGEAVLLDEFVLANVPNLELTKVIDRNETLPADEYIVHRQAVNKTGLVNENAVAYSVTIGTEVGDFEFNWIGLINKASNTVAMIAHSPTQKKLKTQNGQQGNVLTRSFVLEFLGAAIETQINTYAETWQIDFTARLTGIDEMQRLTNVDHYGEAAFFGDGFLVKRDNEQFTVKAGLGYINGLRGELEKPQILNGLRNVSIYADFSYQGNITSEWQTKVDITARESLQHYVDSVGFNHYVFAIAHIDKDGNVKDLRLQPLVNKLKKQIANCQSELAQSAISTGYNPHRHYYVGHLVWTGGYWYECYHPDGCKGIDPRDKEHRPSGWLNKDNSQPYYWINLGKFLSLPIIGMPIPLPSLYLQEGIIKYRNDNQLHKDKFWRLAQLYPNLVNDNVLTIADLRGEFIRGLDDGCGIDNHRALLSQQNDAIRNIQGSLDSHPEYNPNDASASAFGNQTGALNLIRRASRFTSSSFAIQPSYQPTNDIIYFDASRVVPTANENRPRNIAFLYGTRI